MNQNPELKAFFEDGFCDQYWGPGLTDEVSRQEAHQVVRLLDAERGHILDWRGGWGRHAIHFAEMGFDVTLLDFIGRYLQTAKERFHEKGLTLNTIVADCRDTPPSIQADFATCLSNSVGFLEPEEELRSFTSLHAALRPGARVVMDCVNLFSIASRFRPASERTGEDETIYRSQADFELQTNLLRTSFEILRPDGTQARKEFNQTMYTPHDLSLLMMQAGFEVERICGSFAGEPASFESRKIVLVART